MVTLVASGFQVELTDDLVEATKARVRALSPGEVLEISVRDRDGETWVFIPHGCPVAIHPLGDGRADAEGVLSVVRAGLPGASRVARVDGSGDGAVVVAVAADQR